MSLALEDLDWEDDARCAGRPAEWFWTNRAAVSAERDAALECCNGDTGCPVRRQCLAYAIAYNQNAGTWGGMLSHERGDLARTRCRQCRTPLGRRTIADMVHGGQRHARCAQCRSWVEAIPSWDRPYRNSWITGSGRRT